MDFIYDVYRFTANYISFLPLLIGLYRFKKLDKAFIIILAMVVLETTIAVYSKWQGNNGINNLPSLHLLTFLEALLGGFFFYRILEHRILKRIVFFTSVLFLLYTSYNSLFLESIYEFNQIPRMMEGYLFVVYSSFYFYELINSHIIINLYNSPIFWTVVGFVTYFGTTQFIHLFSAFLRDNHFSFYNIMREVNRVMIIFYYLIFAFALWKKK